MLQRKGMEVQTLFEWFKDIREETEPEYPRARFQVRIVIGRLVVSFALCAIFQAVWVRPRGTER
jgi:hypothetical protein